jgi:hypothetical protein
MINGRLTLDEAASRLFGPAAEARERRRRREAVWRAIWAGDLPAVKAGSSRTSAWLIRPADLEDYARRRLPGVRHPPPD